MNKDNESVDGFFELLASREDGALIPELDGMIRKLTQLCEKRGGAGSISLTIKIKREEKHEQPIFIVEHDVVLKEPKIPRKPGLLFSDRQGNLSMYMPEQQSLDGMEPTNERVVPFHHNEGE